MKSGIHLPKYRDAIFQSKTTIRNRNIKSGTPFIYDESAILMKNIMFLFLW
jgi:hypothetical protein